jgi:BirA family biotin operon repressor/biotin-[acetyl-CoA-carboxylase] ligase
MNDAASTAAVLEDAGLAGASLAERLGLPRVHQFEEVGSTQDVAHERAALGDPAGTLVLARSQSAGRGRMGRRWRSERGKGVWLTLIERPTDPTVVDLLSIRIGLRAAEALEPMAPDSICLKWPNDLLMSGRKLGGVLVEARWRGKTLDWVAIGFGLNLVAPDEEPGAIGLGADIGPQAVLQTLVPAIRLAAATPGLLSLSELAQFDRRDASRGRRAVAPVVGTIEGIDSSGALLVRTDSLASRVEVVRSGSLVFAEES